MTAAERVAALVVGAYAGEPPRRLEPQEGGLNRRVFEAEAGERRFIVRLSLPGKAAVFEKERRVCDKARAVGLPAPEVFCVGEAEGWSFMIASHAGGTPATDRPDRLDLLQALGALAARIHQIATLGHGPDFHWPEDPASGPAADWAAWLDVGLDAGGRLALLRDLDLLSARQQALFAEGLKQVRAWRQAPCLQHGDLRLKNVVADPDGRITGLIDWEAAISSKGHHWDLSIALHDLSIDAKEAFLDGYGLSPAEVREASGVWRLFNVLNYAPGARAACEAGDGGALDRMRTRLAGALDLFGCA